MTVLALALASLAFVLFLIASFNTPKRTGSERTWCRSGWQR